VAIGARAADIARLVSADILLIVIVSALAGLGLGLASAQYADLAILVLPSLAIIATALLAALRQ
jgi:hypothetical protein